MSSQAGDPTGSRGPDVASRRQEFSASTRRALVDVAEELFAEQGYAATSLEQVVSGARVTKGALYHHFSGKQALFDAVFGRVEATAGQAIQAALDRQSDPWEKADAGVRAFLEVVQRPDYRRVVVQDGPSVLGYERFREQEERSTFATVVEIVRMVLPTQAW
ncbi:TetR/AcrR family transcriptional regulator [Nocardioides sp. Soil805]|uniref:TetR/AcrR family transcriptional regulator n=1 Tax=Nocardioides sp. Soil805 TaxID=1736416 RepID=UPI001F383D54|nr:TetR/AcrR family transcriptional regulator [Nocardioides sp. Soil805]